jgi:hypothetical protein
MTGGRGNVYYPLLASLFYSIFVLDLNIVEWGAVKAEHGEK